MGFYIGPHGFHKVVFAFMLPGMGFRLYTLWSTGRNVWWRRLYRGLTAWTR